MGKDIIAKKFIWIWLILIFSFVLFGCNRTEIGYTGGEATEAVTNKVGEEAAGLIDEEGSYDTADEVALYLITYHRLPGNYITKNEAKKLGWEGGPLDEYAPGKCIGGDTFGNREGLLPSGHVYHECDIETLGKEKRGAKRLVYSEDFEIYYTADHYGSFTRLY